ncbi:GNAT family N-acetyltransferase [Allosaccharopolyspora coralli]|uniref:GNAT family N-acetyltransferase n=1 Tax=Allosaccharopolyspora coralli TaxID=2665642 RepID=A0A5Q3QDR2_9PSEU|nr:GNAT family N-acetyltransferase [Allosaccharopolyspora coralli]QGK71354.1 GNAT family N-acetyltransferase [Allosaccharopolyspora coralli]
MDTPREKLHHDGVDLRRWEHSDVDEALRVVTESHDHLTPWMAWANGYGHDKAVEFLSRSDECWREGRAFSYAILSGQGAIIGACELMARIGAGGLEIGYWLHPRHTGHGVMTRAVAALIDEAWRIGADHVEIVHDEANIASGAIPRRLGFTEVDRRSPPQQPVTSAEVGVDVVWRLTR